MRHKMLRPLGPKRASAATAQISGKCPKCQERRYQRAVDEIFSVVDGRFTTVEEKLRELHKMQDIRDEAMQAWSDHKQSHRTSPHGVPKVRPEEKRIG